MGDATAGSAAGRPPTSSRRRLVAFVIGVGLVVSGVVWALQQHQLLEALRRVSPAMIAALFALSAMALMAQALRFRVAAPVPSGPWP